MGAKWLIAGTAAGLLVGGAGIIARRDYRAWIDLGEGGVPHGLRGWVQVTRLRFEGGDPFDISGLRESATGSDLERLPRRAGSRPRVAPHPIPHRQLGDDCSPRMLTALDAVFKNELATRSDVVEKQSQYERHHPALYAQPLVDCGLSASGEVGHFHRPQGSLHLHLRPADARVVIDRGWGELHSLSGRRANLPESYTLIYAPRSEDEVAVIASILRATLDWASDPSDT